MKKFLTMIVVLFALFTFSCSTITPPVTKPAECSKSMIWSASAFTGMSPTTISTILKIANTKFLSSKVYTSEYIIAFLQGMDRLLESSDKVTYLEVVNRVSSSIGWLKGSSGPVIELVAIVFGNYLSQPIPIDACDRQLMRQFVSDQLVVVADFVKPL